jgi:hypothetical protein
MPNEDQGLALIKEGCARCTRFGRTPAGQTVLQRTALVKELRQGVLWWVCPDCKVIYGPAPPDNTMH